MADDQFRVMPNLADGRVLIAVGGVLDRVSAEDLAGPVLGLIDAEHRSVWVHLGALTFCDSIGLRALLRIYTEVARHGGRLTIHKPNAAARRKLEITGITPGLTLAG